MEIDELIEEIIELEWHAFTNVENEGGRASCQDDKDTFYIMRKSQYLCWPKDLLESYKEDFIKANRRGWNLVAEKYGRMEEYTFPENYLKLEAMLPVLTREQVEVIDFIVNVELEWTKDFYTRNPEISKKARPIDEDVNGLTSSETYLRGELGTYSLKTLNLYKKWIENLKLNGENLVEMTILNTLNLYKKSRCE